MLLLVAFLLISYISTSYAYLHVPTVRFGTVQRASMAAADAPTVEERIQGIITTNKVVLFMKGEKLRPQCGFSDTACKILRAVNTPFEAVNVLTDQAMRAGIKEFSTWPMIPQLYVHGEFVGGSDIMLEMYKSGELVKLINSSSDNKANVAEETTDDSGVNNVVERSKGGDGVGEET